MAENNEDYGLDILTLVDEEGTEHQFEVADTLDLEDQRYIALIPVFDEAQELVDDDGELVVLKVLTDDENNEFLEPIEDEEEFDSVAGIFMERLEEFYDFED